MRAVKETHVESNKVKVKRIKRFNLDLPPIVEGGPICQKNPYIVHGAEPEHSCTLEIEEIYVTREDYKQLLKEAKEKYCGL